MSKKKLIIYYLLMSLMIGLILFGIIFFMIPVGIRMYREHVRSSIVESYLDAGSEMTQAQKDAEKALCVSYNEALYKVQSGAANSDEDLTILNTYNDRLSGSEEMAVVEIPSIGLKIPVYHSSTQASLEKGAGHMEETSLPIGGVNTHSVISAHNGDPYSDSFCQIDRLAEGDLFNITVNGETLTYAIDKITTVEPDNMTEIKIIPGEDHATLLTCTPRNINSHRLLVRGIRTETVPSDEMDTGWSETTIYAFLGTLILMAMIAETINIRRRKKRKEQEEEKGKKGRDT